MSIEVWQKKGRWTDVFNFPNVVVHASLLPNGKVLHWGRRKDPTKTPSDADLNENFTVSYLWTPAVYPEQPVKGILGKSDRIKDEKQPLYNPTGKKDETVNVFCSGHCFLPSGNLLVVGGHIEDGVGVEQASIFDYQANKWIPQPKMNRGRWYPSALTLPDGRVLCLSGSDGKAVGNKFEPNNNNIPQIYTETPNPNSWVEVADAFETTQRKLMLDLFPRLHIDPTNGQVFMAGPKPDSWFLELKEANGTEIKSSSGVVGRWIDAGTKRTAGARDYAPSVMYDSGKIMYIGGGADRITASNVTEFIDLNKTAKWDSETAKLNTARKQFNATVLPDGTVLVNGGTSGPGFNDLVADKDGKNGPVKTAELMNPSVEPRQWIEMAKESMSRCYHSIALLLPDGRVLSAGGGEAGGIPANECHTEGQLFEPPYLFKGPRPTILSAPSVIEYGKEFSVTVGTNDLIGKISLVRLGSVTHCCNMNQSLVFLDGLRQDGPKLTIQAPANPNVAPPGHYMLFVLNKVKVPSVAASAFIRIPPATAGKITTSTRVADVAQHTAVAKQIQPTLMEHDERVIAEQARPHVVVGLTPLCPYGLGPCWGGAYDGLQAVTDIDVVRPVPHHHDCLAFVYLQQDILPDIDVWRTEFEGVANKSYNMRGIEMTISGAVTKEKSGTDEQLTLAGTSTRPQLILAPFQATSQLKWDIKANAPKPISDAEAAAYERLAATLAGHPAEVTVQVTGTLQKHGADKFSLDVRDFEVLDAASS
jgi:galactose oxidase